jgi:hypothetical protein
MGRFASNPQGFAKNTAEIAVPPSIPASARAFVVYALSPAGEQVLAAAGFQQP